MSMVSTLTPATRRSFTMLSPGCVDVAPVDDVAALLDPWNEREGSRCLGALPFNGVPPIGSVITSTRSGVPHQLLAAGLASLVRPNQQAGSALSDDGQQLATELRLRRGNPPLASYSGHRQSVPPRGR
jgi:hypothetical protein